MSTKFVSLLLCLLLLAVPALAGEAPRIQGLSLPADADYLDLGAHAVSDFPGLMEELKAFPALRKVDLFESRPTQEQAFALAEAFPGIRFGMTLKIAGFLCRTDDLVFSMHKRANPLYPSEAFRQLALCRDMRALDLGHNKITGLEFLSGLSELRYLILADNSITDLKPLENLKNLQYLELFLNKVSDLSPLMGLHNLLDLNISDNTFSDLGPLYEMPFLKRLWMVRNGLTSAAVQPLKEALPDTEIFGVGRQMATWGGWREHPRFFIMRRTFDKGVFEAFEEELKTP